jgi:hypothetical protein
MRQLGPDRYQEMLPVIRELVADNPHYLPTNGTVEGYAQAINAVVKLAEHDQLQRRVAELEQERAEKLAAQTVTGAGRGSIYTEDEQEAMRQRIRNAPERSVGALFRSPNGG